MAITDQFKYLTSLQDFGGTRTLLSGLNYLTITKLHFDLVDKFQ